VEEQLPGERRERRFARSAEKGHPSNAAAPSTAIESPPQTASADGEQKAADANEAEIMTRLPHARPERRSTRRTGSTGQRRRTSTARGAGRKRAATTKKAAGRVPPTRGLREQITDATIQTATMPFRATFGLARRAGRLLERLR
jgi:hypothetical protein